MAATLPNIDALVAMGINPKTGLPIKMGGTPCMLKEDIKKFLRLIDEQDACNRYTWYNIPCNITSQELERMLYYKGQLCLFYSKDLDEFYFMPYALDGTIDFYGRFNQIHPVPMTSGTDDKGQKAQAELLSNIKLKPVYGIVEDTSNIDYEKCCVLLHDYTKQLSQTIIPRQFINDPILDVMAECVPYMRTNLIISSGVEAIRVKDADSSSSVEEANKSIERAAQTGRPYIPVVGPVDFQELAKGATSKSEEYMLAMQSLDNLRLSGYGIDNGGLFEKKAHELQSEADINGGPVGLVLQDGLEIRQNFCNIVNSIFGIGIWCEVNQNVSGTDVDGDGKFYETDEEGSNTGVEGGDNDGNDSDI